MQQIECPWCGYRDDVEFLCAGESNVRRPAHGSTSDASDDEWTDYLFFRRNTKGLHEEVWCHHQGCRQWFLIERDTVSHRIKSCSKLA